MKPSSDIGVSGVYGHAKEESGTLAARDSRWRNGRRALAIQIRAQFLAGDAGDPLKLQDAIHVARDTRFAPFVDGLRGDVQGPRQRADTTGTLYNLLDQCCCHAAKSTTG